MPQYIYKCTDAECNVQMGLFRPSYHRDDPAECPVCGMPTHRIYFPSAPVINTRACSDPNYEINKNFEGFSETERTATRKADDAKYNAAYGNRF